MTRDEAMTLKPGERVLVSYDLGNTEGEVVRGGDRFGWVLVRQPYCDGAHLDVECAAEFIVRAGEEAAPTPLQRIYQALAR